MIQHLDATIENLLKHDKYGIADATLRTELRVVFSPPDENFAPSVSTVNVFLEKIHERKEMRGEGEEVRRDAATDIVYRTPAPVWIDCNYLITAWTDAASPDVLKEHEILAGVVASLIRNEEFPQDVLCGSLATDPPGAVIFETKTLSSERPDAGDAFQGRPKAAVHYTVTMGMYVREEIKTGDPIKERVFKAGEKSEKPDTFERLVFKGKNRTPEK